MKPVSPTPAGKHPEKKTHWNAMTIGATVVLIVVGVTFIGAPVISNSIGGPSVSFGSYDGVTISYAEGNAFAESVRNLSRQYGSEMDNESAKRFIWRRAFDDAVLSTALEHEARKAGILISDKRVKKAMQFNAAFLDKNGNFDHAKDQAMSAAEKFRIKTQTESDMLVRTYASMLMGATLVENKKNAEFIEKQIYPQRQFSFIVFDEKDYPESEVVAYIGKNANLFQTITLRRITLSNEAEAKAKREEALKKTQPFETMAKEFSKDELGAAGGLMGTKYYHELKREIEKADELDAVFKLKKDEISYIIKTAGGFSFYQVVEEAKAPETPPAPALIQNALAYLGSSEGAQIQNFLEAKAKTFKASATGKTFADEAKKLGKTPETAGPIAVNFGNSSYAPLVSGASQNPVFANSTLGIEVEFFQKAFAVNVDEITDPILTFTSENGGRHPKVIVMKLDSLIPAPPAADQEFASKVASVGAQDTQKDLIDGIMKSPKFKDHFEEGLKAFFKSVQ